MAKNLTILLIVVFVIGVMLNIYLSNIDNGPKVPEIKITFNLANIDSTFFNSKTQVFDDILVNYLYKLERTLLNTKTKFDSETSKEFALGLLYFSRYKELISARNLLSELNNNLYFNPRSNKHKSKIPMLTSMVNADSKLIQTKDEYSNYQNELRNIYGQNKLLYSSYFTMNPSELISLEDEIQGKIDIYNPYFYNQKAHSYFRKSKLHFNNFLDAYNQDDEFYLMAVIKLNLLNMYNDNDDNNDLITNDLFDKVIDLLNNKKNRFQLDLVDFLVLAENNKYVDKNISKGFYKKINDKAIKVLYKMKRKLFDLEAFDKRKIKNIDCEELKDRYFPSELYITESELIYKNSYLEINENSSIDYVDAADSKINNFWTKCVAVTKGTTMDCSTPGSLKYNNYSSTLLNSFRLGLWHGGELPNWRSRIRRIFEKTTDSKIVDPVFYNLINQIDIWIQRII